MDDSFLDSLEEGECITLQEDDGNGMEVVACKVEDDVEYQIRDDEGNTKQVLPMEL